MKITSMRRIAAAAFVPALVAGTVLAAPSAQAATNAAEDSAATWLAEQPKIDGLFTSYYGPTRAESFVDYGLNLDLWVALDTLGRDAAGEKIYDAVIDGADAYTDSFGTRYAGALGKLAAHVQRHDDTATATIGSRDLIAETEATVVTEGAATGRATDRDLATGDTVSAFESSNSIGQGFVVRALDTAASPLADETLAYLLKQQCDDGSFRVVLADTQCTTGTGTIDGTAFALQTLDAVGGPTAAVDDAVDYLVAQQQADGSFQDDGASNTNSTGLAAVALEDHAEPTAAARAAGWVESRQVASGDEEGAIALDDADFAAASAAPIARLDRDRYVRASVQAALSLRALDAPTAVTVTAPAGFVKAGTSIAVSATGLAPNEAFTARVGSGEPVRGTATASGTVATSVPTPAGTATRTVTVQGTNNDRSGTAAVKVLGPKVLSLKLNASSVAKGRSQVAKVSGLVANEPVTIRLGGTTVKSATAYSDGTYTVSFKVGSTAGKRTVKATGRFSDRTVSKTFTVK